MLSEHESMALALVDASARIYAGTPCHARKAPDMQWRERECSRFLSNQYEPLVWSNEYWWLNRQGDLKHHYAHRSATTHGLVAYTESAEKGEQDRQTVCKPGVYLT